MDKEKIEQLANEVFEAERRYRQLGMMNTFGLSKEKLSELNTNYILAETEMIEARQALREAQGLK